MSTIFLTSAKWSLTLRLHPCLDAGGYEGEGWFLDLVHYQIVTSGLVRVDSVLMGSVTVSGGLTAFTIAATSSPPPVAVSVPSLILTQQNIGTPCRLDFR